jgi:O-antigen ligase
MVLSLAANLLRYPLGDLLVAALYAVRWLLFVSMYFVLKDSDEKFVRRLPDLLTAMGAVVLGIGYVQYFFYSNLRNLYYLGWDDHLYRLFSSFFDPNFAGSFLVLYFLFVLGQIVHGKADHSKDEQQQGLRNRFWTSQHDKLKKVIYGVLALASFIAIFLTTSRSAIIMLALGLVSYLLLIGQKKWILAFIAVVVVIFLGASRFFYLENVNPFRMASSTARIESANNAISIISRNVLFGVGFNAYRYAQYEYGFRQEDTRYPNHADSGTDNSFLFVFATTGLVGFAAFLYLLYRMVFLAQYRRDSVMGKILLVSLLGICADSFFINSLFYPAILYWLVVIAALTDYT